MTKHNRTSIGLVVLALILALVAVVELQRRADETLSRLDAAKQSWSSETRTTSPDFSYDRYAKIVAERQAARGDTLPLSALTVDPGAKPRSKMSSDLVAALDADSNGEDRHRVIVQIASEPGVARAAAISEIRSVASQHGSAFVKEIPLINAVVLDLDAEGLMSLATMPNVARLASDAIVRGSVGVASEAIGAVLAQNLSVTGYDGEGVTVAVIDSGVYRYHEDLRVECDASMEKLQSVTGRIHNLNEEVEDMWNGESGWSGRAISIDFTDRKQTGWDEYGHGTHVASTIGGSSNTSWWEQSHRDYAGIAPAVTIISLKVLDENGEGYTSHVLEAIAFLVDNHNVLGTRVLNMSLGHPVYESYETDPLALACAAASQAGIAVVCSAGNNGTGAVGATYGTINSPGNAPWVITVGSTDTNGTVERSDDTIAPYSSVGPTAIDGHFKPDLVAPGTGIITSMDLDCELAKDYSQLLRGPSFQDFGYMEMSGTSMSAAVVSGTIALMLEANPSLTPNAVKAILMYTAEKMTTPDILQQGCGSLNAEGAVRLAQAIRLDSDTVLVGDLWLDAASEEAALGMLDPFTMIGGQPVFWGSVLLWGDGFTWGGGVGVGGVGGNGTFTWGDGFLWNSVLNWANGFQWFDSVIGNQQDVMANCFLWFTGCTGGGGGVGGTAWDPDTQQATQALWYPEVMANWTGSFVDPMSIHPEQFEEQVLATGEAGGTAGNYVTGAAGDWFFPVQPNQ